MCYLKYVVTFGLFVVIQSLSKCPSRQTRLGKVLYLGQWFLGPSANFTGVCRMTEMYVKLIIISILTKLRLKELTRDDKCKIFSLKNMQFSKHLEGSVPTHLCLCHIPAATPRLLGQVCLVRVRLQERAWLLV